jgi:hypothetical protein
MEEREERWESRKGVTRKRDGRGRSESGGWEKRWEEKWEVRKRVFRFGRDRKSGRELGGWEESWV